MDLKGLYIYISQNDTLSSPCKEDGLDSEEDVSPCEGD